MSALLTNNAYSTLLAGINNSVTALTVAVGEGARFPNPGGGQYFYCTLSDASGATIEIVKVTARVTDVFTIVRGQDGTTGQAFSAGDFVELRPIAELFREKLDALRGTWKLLYSDGSGVIQELALGAADTVLQSAGASSAPIFGTGVPTGTIVAFGGTSAPSGWALCYGQTFLRSAPLFSVIGTTYGVGDGSTTANLPDLRGRVIAGQDDMGGTSANRLTGVTGSVDGDTLGGTGGEETHTLITAEMPSHNHRLASTATGSDYATANGNGAVGGGTEVTEATGGGGAHNNVQPTIVLNYIIKE